MSQRFGDKREMPDVPKFDFVDALSEIWFQINFAAYHMAYVRVYSQSDALRTQTQVLRAQDQDVRNDVQIDIVICRSHLAAFFWHLEHVFEALRIAITLGQKDLPEEKHFWVYERRLDDLEQLSIRQEIKTTGIWGTKPQRSLEVSGMRKETSYIISCRPSAPILHKRTSR